MRLVLLVGVLLTSPTTWSANGSACGLIKKNSVQELANWHDSMNCADLAVGQKRQVQNDVGIPANYIINHIDEGKYQIDIPLDITASFKQRLMGSNAAKFSEDKMRAKILSCAKESQHNLKGPNGEQLILNPIMKKEERTIWHWGLTSSVTVQTSPHFRSDSKNYAEDLNCAGIVHELLHLLGLADEYSEEIIESSYYKCRVIGPQRSIMNDPSEAFKMVGHPIHKFTHNFQYCIETEYGGWTNRCHSVEINSEHENYKMDPDIFNDKPFQKSYPQKVGDEVVTLQEGVGNDNGLLSTKVKTITMKHIGSKKIDTTKSPLKILADSVLEPAHFRAILYPGCKKKNAVYYNCSSLALRTYVLPVLAYSGKNCEIPPECKNGDWLK